MANQAIPLVKVAMAPEETLWPMLREVLYSGQIGDGETVARFEAAFAEHFAIPLALSMQSGTAALHAALTLAGVRSGDEVISSPMTAEPTNIAILHTGARVIWADVDPRSGNIDPESIRRNITPRTKAIMVVHYGGLPVRLAEILKIAKEHNLPVIEDCAHALGATYQGASVGTLSHYGIFSFQAIKHMTTVDGGMLTLRDASQLRAARLFRWFGLERGVARTAVDITSVGYKYNMNNVTAAIGLAQLQQIGSLLERHKSNGKYFDRVLSSIPGVEVATFDAQAEPSYWYYTILTDHSDDIIKKLEENGISASKLHKRNDLHSIFADARTELPGLDKFYRRMLHIPCGWWVDDEARETIANVLRQG